jgi:chemotaxis protein MotB
MMTMFILFLSLFVYQAAHKDLLVSDTPEVIAGRTVDAIEIEERGKASFPFTVIKPAAPFMIAGTIPKAEPMHLQDVDLGTTFSQKDVEKTLAELSRDIPKAPPPPVSPSLPEQSLSTTSLPAETGADIFQPLPLQAAEEQATENTINTLFAQGRKTLDSFNLNEFASIDLVPDKAVHIVLTGDLLFPSGQAALTQGAMQSLEKIAAVISNTPHRIHVEGHTDNVPIFSERYSDNWELSVARANAVASFLIRDMGMNPRQFVVSGYSSYQPVAPNTSEWNRAANRRVEIVISRSPSQQDIATLSPISLSLSAL